MYELKVHVIRNMKKLKSCVNKYVTCFNTHTFILINRNPNQLNICLRSTLTLQGFQKWPVVGGNLPLVTKLGAAHFSDKNRIKVVCTVIEHLLALDRGSKFDV